MMYAVSVIVTTEKDGWTCAVGVPTFFLDSNVQGIVSESHAQEIATSMFTRLGHFAENVNVAILRDRSH